METYKGCPLTHPGSWPASMPSLNEAVSLLRLARGTHDGWTCSVSSASAQVRLRHTFTRVIWDGRHLSSIAFYCLHDLLDLHHFHSHSYLINKVIKTHSGLGLCSLEKSGKLIITDHAITSRLFLADSQWLHTAIFQAERIAVLVRAILALQRLELEAGGGKTTWI